MGQSEKIFIDLLRSLTRVEPRTFPWLINKFGADDIPIKNVFSALNGDLQGLAGKKEMKLRPDAFLPDLNCLIEFDEVQHFTSQREIALSLYPDGLSFGYERDSYISLCKRYGTIAAKKGAAGYRRPTAEFPFVGGRHFQRAFFDTLRDILPLRNGLSPTIRIPEFEMLNKGALMEKISRLVRT
ncbi:hypothetical protein [Tabrizicola sp.]|uniref:hypothetical protein n=1 Tax=Tabrizicola sp. TaxID=2005166 RepID=UPI0026114F7D|nr:hypothetical protein [Tabrizicola sp.]MDM7933427.1 hypothetical protein [Tabrizicola sp.]